MWNGYCSEEFLFEEHPAIVVFPKQANGSLAVKTEYWDAFPAAIELPLLEQGYHLCFIRNDNRWGTDPDLDRKARFVRFVQEKYGLTGTCVPVGMSCGGLIAAKFAAKYPECIGGLYLDAPVLNLLSCPCGVGAAKDILYEEFVKAMGLTVSDLINYRQHPIDFADMLIQEHIPVALICGDSDCIVPYAENGQVLAEKYRSSTVPFFEVLKPGCDHHPHGLEDNAPLINFVERYGR